MSRYYIYDSYNDSVAEFKEYSTGRSKKGANTAERYTPPGGLKPGQVRVTGSGQNPVGRVRRAVTRGGALTDIVADPSSPYTMRNNAKFLEGLKRKKALIRNLGIAGGVLAAGGGALAGGYALKKRADRKAAELNSIKAAERNSIKGRVKRLLGR